MSENSFPSPLYNFLDSKKKEEPKTNNEQQGKAENVSVS